MRRVLVLLALAAIVIGIAGLAATRERAQAQPPDGRRFDLQCEQILSPNDPANPHPGVGVVRCSLTIDLPDVLTPPWPDTIKLTIYAAYADLDENKHPSRGDRLLCIRVVGPEGNVLVNRCRPGVDLTPEDLFSP